MGVRDNPHADMDDAQTETVRRALDERHDEMDTALAILKSYLQHFCLDLQTT